MASGHAAAEARGVLGVAPFVMRVLRIRAQRACAAGEHRGAAGDDALRRLALFDPVHQGTQPVPAVGGGATSTSLSVSNIQSWASIRCGSRSKLKAKMESDRSGGVTK